MPRGENGDQWTAGAALASWAGAFQRFTSRLQLYNFGRWLALASMVGLVTGLGAVILTWGIDGATSLFMLGGAGFIPPGHGHPWATTWRAPVRPWTFLIILPAAGLLVGWLIERFAPEAEGHGTDAVIRAYHRDRAMVRSRVVPVKLLASLLTIGSGGSAGREGPVAQVGGGFGSSLARVLGLAAGERRMLVIAGMAGGIGGMFRAPLGGALFAIEVLYSENEFESEALIPALISSIVSYVVTTSLTGWGTIFQVPPIGFANPRELVAYLLLGGLLALVGFVYVGVFYGVRNGIFAALPVPRWTRPAIGGFGVALIALVLPQVLGGGYGWLQLTLDGKLGLSLLLLLVPAKIVATALTIGSGGSGGVFAPSLIIGGMTGAVFAQVAQALFPAFAPDPVACVLVGMGGFFAGVAKVPVASLIMVSDMSGSYQLLVPMMLASSVAFLLTRGLSIYDEQVPGRVDSPAHVGDFEVDVLKRLSVRDVMRTDGVSTVHRSTPFAELVEIVSSTTQDLFPVTDGEGALVGIFSVSDVRNLMATPEIWSALVAEDLAVEAEGIAYLRPEDDLHVALRRFTALRVTALPVLETAPPARLLAFVTYQEVLQAYDQACRNAQEEATESA